MSKMNAGLLATRRVAPLPCQQPSQLAPLLLHLSFFGKSFGIILATALQRLVFSLLASGRSVVQFFVDLQRMVWRSVGWMSASPRSPALRDLGLRFTLPRWKIFSGKLQIRLPRAVALRSSGTAWTVFRLKTERGFAPHLFKHENSVYVLASLRRQSSAAWGADSAL